MDDDIDIMALIMPVMMLMIMIPLLQGFAPVAPVKDQCCPICGECYYTYEELYSHFASAHPAEPIDIIWD